MPDQITEAAGTILEAPTTGPGAGRMRVLCISEGRGSSGYYPKATLQEAARNGLIKAGQTMAYLDHPSATEAMDRPERSVRDLAGVFTSDAQWSDEHNGLVAEMRVFAPYQPLIAEMHDVIGLSIRGDGEIEMREGQRTVTQLAHIQSVDFVTQAGRGGKVLELLESARRQPVAEARNVGQHLESRMHQDFTNRADDMAAQGHLTREERIHLSGAVGQGLTAFAGHLEEHAPQLYQRDIYDEPGTKPDVSESATTTVPADSGVVIPTPKKEGLVPELTEAEVTALRDQAARAEAAERQLAESNARLAALQARDTVRPGVAAKVAESTVLAGRAKTQSRVVESVLRDLPMTDGKVDDTALAAAIESAVKEAEAEFADVPAAPVRESYGAFGSRQGVQQHGAAVSEADLAAYDKASAPTFGRNLTGA